MTRAKIETYHVGNGWVVAQGYWLPGLYDSEQTARYACRLSDRILTHVAETISSVHGENRMITMNDLRAGK